MFVQPNYDWVQDHCDKEDQREEQNHGLQRTQNQPNNEQEEYQPHDTPGAVIAQRRVRILAMRLIHEVQGDLGAGEPE
jgi:hypothetical protein